MSLPPFEQVLTEHGPGLLRFCVSRAGAADGEDVFQETMLSALRGYPQLRDAEAVALPSRRARQSTPTASPLAHRSRSRRSSRWRSRRFNPRPLTARYGSW